VSGGGVLLNNLFEKFPAENLFFFHRDFNQPLKPIKFKEYRLLWNWLRPNIIDFARNILKWIYFVTQHPRDSKISDIAYIFLQSSQFHFPAAVDREIRNFNPEIIYAWTASPLWANTLQSVAVRYNLPYVIHFMDNHVEVKPTIALEKVLQAKLAKSLSLLVRNASGILCISEAMKYGYKKKWGIESEVFHGSIDTSKWPFPEEREQNNDFILLFNGSVDRGVLLGLIDIAKAVELLQLKGIRIKLIILVSASYSQVVIDSLSRFNCVDIQLQSSFNNLRSYLINADLLIIAYGFDDKTVSYFKYSFATKVVPYMLSGQCILAYGPSDIEPIDYVKRGQWGVTVTDQNIESIATTISSLYYNPKERMRLAKLAWTVAKEEHDSQANGIRFENYLRFLINKKV
jgi:glycosyltransferase involved in cell wall biosynthesis